MTAISDDPLTGVGPQGKPPLPWWKQGKDATNIPDQRPKAWISISSEGIQFGLPAGSQNNLPRLLLNI